MLFKAWVSIYHVIQLVVQIRTGRCYFINVNILLRLLKAKTRNEIRAGKLWEITRLWGMDICKVEKEVAKPAPFVRPEGGQANAMRVHILKEEDNKTNLTKKPDLL